MGKSLNIYHKIFLLLMIIFLISCNQKRTLYKAERSVEAEQSIAEGLSNGIGLYYQGSVPEQLLLNEALERMPEEADLWREKGIPFLKRGIASEAFRYYNKAMQYGAEEWIGYMGYCWLYFYRDYERAIEYLDRCDAYTPDFVDYPQATSVDYMRGVALLKLGKLEKAIAILEKHLEKEISETGASYVEIVSFQMLAIAYLESGLHQEADKYFRLGLEHNKGSADLWFYHAKNLMKMDNKEESKNALDQAFHWFRQGNINTRPYVEEFYAVYIEDLQALREEMQVIN